MEKTFVEKLIAELDIKYVFVLEKLQGNNVENTLAAKINGRIDWNIKLKPVAVFDGAPLYEIKVIKKV